MTDDTTKPRRYRVTVRVYVTFQVDAANIHDAETEALRQTHQMLKDRKPADDVDDDIEIYESRPLPEKDDDYA